jgi:ATP-dependent DNA helicase RecG
MGASKRKIYDVTVSDTTGKVHCKFFRVPYRGYFERFQPGQKIRVVGKVGEYRGQIEFNHPDLQEDAEQEEADVILPIYEETDGLSTRQLSKIIKFCLQEIKDSPEVMREKSPRLSPDQPVFRSAHYAPKTAALPPPLDKIPVSVKYAYQLPDRYESLCNIHDPPKTSDELVLQQFVEQKSPHHRRIIFEEFFWLELVLAAKRSGFKKEPAFAFKKDFSLVEKLQAQLPFSLTNAQKKAFVEIANDLSRPSPMHRLVQGDVGSGKTLVALMAALLAKQNGFQSSIMVPTEILAEQHFQNSKKWLEPLGVTVGLLTGSMKQSERNQTNLLLESGAIDLCVGTHALIQDTVNFKNLGLVIIDEQHRFGVHQRAALKQKGLSPHFLVMTATPIPRTLAMTVYGDLDVSVIDELPFGRSPIQTRVTYENKRPQVLQFMLEQLKKGRQAYVVYPLVEESEKIDLKDAQSNFEIIQAQFPDFKVGLLHGKMKSAEKEEVMKIFRAGQIQILVSTTVIEVGVDVPNANLMLIEHTERFGLSQLHQLRGRVGRGEHKSFCILMLGHAVSDESRERASIMEKTTDGFKIAEADLELRGPGEFMGTRQSGLPGFKMANLVRDVKILQEARQAAFQILERDPGLEQKENQHLQIALHTTQGPVG